MNRLENILVDLICLEESEHSRWLNLLSKIAEFILNTINRIDRRLRRLRCWFTGHSISFGEHWIQEPDYCPKCFIDWPLEMITLPTLLNKGYCWMVEQDWGWFNYIDERLCRRGFPKWWPAWWEY